MRTFIEVVDHRHEIEHRQAGCLLHRSCVGRQHGAFENDGAHVRMLILEFSRTGNRLGLDQVGIKLATFFKDGFLKVRLILHAFDHDVDFALDPGEFQNAISEFSPGRGNAADWARGP